jgi:chromosome segregation ATPase
MTKDVIQAINLVRAELLKLERSSNGERHQVNEKQELLAQLQEAIAVKQAELGTVNQAAVTARQVARENSLKLETEFERHKAWVKQKQSEMEAEAAQATIKLHTAHKDAEVVLAKLLAEQQTRVDALQTQRAQLEDVVSQLRGVLQSVSGKV